MSSKPAEVIQAWAVDAAPSCYKDLLSSASEFDWIAFVPSNLACEFGEYLRSSGWCDDDQIRYCAVPDGGFVFCGPFEKTTDQMSRRSAT
jgi:hypothetical protein